MTSAEHIREEAAALGYWAASPAVRQTLRKVIEVDSKGAFTRQAIELALKRGSKPGKPAHPRCPHCGQRMPKETTPKRAVKAGRKVA